MSLRVLSLSYQCVLFSVFYCFSVYVCLSSVYIMRHVAGNTLNWMYRWTMPRRRCQATAWDSSATYRRITIDTLIPLSISVITLSRRFFSSIWFDCKSYTEI